MSDLSGVPDEELLAMYAMPSLIQRESGGRPGVVGPKTRYGRAEGMTQMLPATAQATAKKLGVEWRPDLMRGTTPEAADYQQRLGQAYLAEGIAQTGSLEDGLRYYHGGPDKRLWKRKTNAYSDAVMTSLHGVGQSADLSGVSDEDLLAMYGDAAPAPPRPQAAPMRVAQAFPANAPAVAAAKPEPLRPNDLLGVQTGVLKPWDKAASLLEQGLERVGVPAKEINAALGFPSTAAIAADRKAALAERAKAGERPGKLGEFVGNVGATALIPGGPITSGAIGGVLLSDAKDLVGTGIDAALGGVGGKLGDLVAKGAGGLIGAGFKKKLATMSAEELQAAKRAAYAAVDNEGVKYAKTGFKDLIAGISDDLSDLDRDVTPKAAAVLENIRKRAGQEPSLTDLDKLRQYVRLTLGGKTADDAERRYAGIIINNIDEFIGAKFPRTVAGSGEKGAALIKTARDLNARSKKVEAVQDAVDEARLRTARSGIGGNAENAIRQELAKVLKTQPGLKPAERAALEKAIEGGSWQNAMRMLGRLSPTTGGLSALLNLGATAYNPQMAAFGLAGVIGKKASEMGAAKNIDDILRLMAAGGKPEAVVRPPPAAVLKLQEGVRKLAKPTAAVGTVGATNANR